MNLAGRERKTDLGFMPHRRFAVYHTPHTVQLPVRALPADVGDSYPAGKTALWRSTRLAGDLAVDSRLKLLWAPWRQQYVSAARPGNQEVCFICSGLAAAQDRENLIVHRSQLSVVILNRYPYNAGHLLIAPRRHEANPSRLTNEEVLDSQTLLARCLEILERLLRPDGFNVGMNLGTAAGAGLPGHMHWHVVPRWSGDTNFMPVLGDAKVISQSLSALWELLQEHFRAMTP